MATRVATSFSLSFSRPRRRRFVKITVNSTPATPRGRQIPCDFDPATAVATPVYREFDLSTRRRVIFQAILGLATLGDIEFHVIFAFSRVAA